MRKFAPMLAGLMVVSAPALLSAPTDVYAAAKGKKAASLKTPKRAARDRRPLARDGYEQEQAGFIRGYGQESGFIRGYGGIDGFFRSLSDLGASLSRPYVYNPGGQPGGGSKAGRAPAERPAARRGGGGGGGGGEEELD